jgi:hypothetical protein
MLAHLCFLFLMPNVVAESPGHLVAFLLYKHARLAQSDRA